MIQNKLKINKLDRTIHLEGGGWVVERGGAEGWGSALEMEGGVVVVGVAAEDDLARI